MQPLPPELAAVEKKCDIRAPFFRFTKSGNVLVMPDPAEKYEAVDCAIAALKRPDLAKYADRLGFVGNEAYAKEEKE